MRTTNQLMQCSDVFQLGNLVFTIKNCDVDFIHELSLIIPICQASEVHEVVELSTGCDRDVRNMLMRIRKRHLGSVHIDSSCLKTPSNKNVLLAGPSFSGKTTLALTLVLGQSWSLICEGVTLIDVVTDRLIPYAAPFSVRSGTAEIINKFLEKELVVPTTMSWSAKERTDAWFSAKEYAQASPVEARFDVALFCEPFETFHKTFSVAHISTNNFLRKILPVSNVVNVTGGIDKLSDYLGNAVCLNISGGSLRDRLDVINQFV